MKKDIYRRNNGRVNIFKTLSDIDIRTDNILDIAKKYIKHMEVYNTWQ